MVLFKPQETIHESHEGTAERSVIKTVVRMGRTQVVADLMDLLNSCAQKRPQRRCSDNVGE